MKYAAIKRQNGCDITPACAMKAIKTAVRNVQARASLMPRGYAGATPVIIAKERPTRIRRPAAAPHSAKDATTTTTATATATTTATDQKVVRQAKKRVLRSALPFSGA